MDASARSALTSFPRAALAGFLAAAAALGTGELFSGFSRRIPSLVIAVADIFVDETPGGIVRWSIDTFGTNQKKLLVTGIVVTSLVVGAVLGVLSRRRAELGASGFAAFGVIGAWAAARGTYTSTSGAIMSAFSAAAIGMAVLFALLRNPGPVTADHDAPAGAGDPGGRRRVLLVGGGAAAWALVSTRLGRVLRDRQSVEDEREAVASLLDTGGTGEDAGGAPSGVGTATGAVEGALDGEVAGITSYLVSNDDFYRIDTAFVVPQIQPDGWSLRIHGLVDQPLELSFAELAAMDQIEAVVTIACVSNEVGGDLVGNARWTGVPLPALLERAGVQDGATQVVGRSIDGWTAGFPTELALDGRPAMLALTMNGEPLPIEHGFPARLIIPGLYGYVSATKWITEIELTTWDAFDGYWVPRGWAKEGPIKTQSRIDVPRSSATIAAGPTPIAGVAWAPLRGIAGVDVKVDDGEWQAARLAETSSELAWVQWVLDWSATPGEHVIAVRATDGTGAVQTADEAPPAPDGATGHHTIRVRVE